MGLTAGATRSTQRTRTTLGDKKSRASRFPALQALGPCAGVRHNCLSNRSGDGTGVSPPCGISVGASLDDARWIDLAAEALHVTAPRRAITVPPPNATVDELAEFALRYDGYGLHGDVETLAAVRDQVALDWKRGSLPDDLDQLRAALCFVQRAAHWNGHFDELFARALIEQIRAVSGSTVDGSGGITV